nr:MAG: hypothetical protein 3 [Leviviridae sp.]
MKLKSEEVFTLIEEYVHAAEGIITSDQNPRQAAIVSLGGSLLKKWLPLETTQPNAEAIKLFRECNKRSAEYLIDESSYHYETLVTARQLLERYFHSGDLQSSVLTLDTALAESRCGPGASMGTRRTDYYGKMFASKLTMTDVGLLGHYRSSISPPWRLAEHLRHQTFGEEVVRGARLSCVPKTSKISRTIATEPTLNMFYQLGAGRVIEGVLRRFFGISLERQPFVNRWYARKGSVDGSFATIDLSSASDTISRELVRFLLPRDVYSVLDLLRTHYVDIAGEPVELGMFSTMGNGFTFPLQTLIFAALIRAHYTRNSLHQRVAGIPQYSVFGDDIIVSREAYDGVCSLLGYAGFSVNFNKSFNAGAFRESCGADYFKGTNIRGVYLRELSTIPSVYSAFNRLSRWSLQHKCDLDPILSRLLGLAPFRPVPFDESDDAGFKIPSAFLTAPKRDSFGCIRYHPLVPVSSRLRIIQYDGVGDGCAKNPFGAMICAIGGYLQGAFATVRTTGEQRYRVVRRKTPSWDFMPYPGLTVREYELLWLGLQSQV